MYFNSHFTPSHTVSNKFTCLNAGAQLVMIAWALPCDGMDSSRRWFESHQSFFCLSTLLSLASLLYIYVLSVPLYMVIENKDD